MNKTKINSRGLNTPRVKWKYTQTISYPSKYRKFLWDYSDGSAPLEIYLLRLLLYGRFEDIKILFSKFPEKVADMIQRYPQIHRGVKFWIRKWHEERK